MIEILEVSIDGVCRDISIGVIDDRLKQVATLSLSGSRNSSPFCRCGSRNTSSVGLTGSGDTSPCRQKVVKMKTRGLDEDIMAMFSKAVYSDVGR